MKATVVNAVATRFTWRFFSFSNNTNLIFKIKTLGLGINAPYKILRSVPWVYLRWSHCSLIRENAETDHGGGQYPV
jgi:hypothetical protein